MLWLDKGRQILLSGDTEAACVLYQRYLDKKLKIEDVQQPLEKTDAR